MILPYLHYSVCVGVAQIREEMDLLQSVNYIPFLGYLCLFPSDWLDIIFFDTVINPDGKSGSLSFSKLAF